MKLNPFYYGEVVTGENFTDRVAEIERLTTELCGGHNIFLISPRRYGKTSLIINALELIKIKGLFVFYMDLYKVASIRELLDAYAKGIVRSCKTRVEKISDFIKELFPTVRPKIILGDDGLPSIEVDIRLKEKELMDSLTEILDVPQKIAKKRKKNFVVVFDEFQEIINFDGERLEKLMRACFQHHHNVAYLFAGSKRHLLNSMVSDPNRAFYKLGDVMNLQKVAPEEMMKFVKKQFSKGPIKINEKIIGTVLEISENVPYNVQYLCHNLWNRCLLTKKNIIDVEGKEIRFNDVFFKEWINKKMLW